jgi:hypothetical protein
MRKELNHFMGVPRQNNPRISFPNTEHNRIKNIPNRNYGHNPFPSDDDDKIVTNNNLLGK